jgi:class 3 adenylate cyclase
MRCSGCGHENPAAAKFCQECGHPLRTSCGACGTDLPPQVKFCHECGQRTTAAAAPQAPPGPSAPEPSELAGGRYQLRRLIGEGTSKRVHLAYDKSLAREVALALIKTEGLDDSRLVRVRREAQAMASLGDHPNIVTVHDIGEEGQQLYIVSQYMQGGDLESRLQAAGETRRLPETDAVDIAMQLCRALRHAHERGVVHRDVKPGNIWLSDDGTAKLGDFGLAVSVDRTRLTQEGMMVGTVAYMAPEQALGRPPGATSDLYALGATLYEMVTGRPPFLGDDAVSIISQHIHTPPVAPSWHNPAVPARLEELILQLLEKDPERRPRDAAGVLERLGHALSASAEGERPAEVEHLNPLDRLASGVFVGRDEALERLRAGVDQALSGHGSVLLLVGEPGIGKTRTSEELVTYARMRGAQALWGHCYEGDGAPAYWPWMQIIRSYVHDCEPKTLLSEMGSGAADIAAIVSEVRERLPGLPEPAQLEPEEARFRLFDSITSFLKNASKQTPIVLVLDDLHWSDRPSLRLLEFLAQDVAGSRILVIGTYRDVEVGRQHPLEQTLAELARTQKSDRVLLRGLTDADVSRFLELSCGSTPPPALVEAVYRETEGNPFFVHEVVRLLQSDGRLDDPHKVASWSVEIPQGVRQVVGRRLDGLSEACNELLTVAAIIGREFELRVLAQAAERSEDEALELLEEAEDARIVGEVDGAPGSYRFSHALIRETLYDEVRTTRRVRMHRRIADVLEQRHAGRLEPHMAELAYHYCEAALGGDVDKAVGYAERAAELAQQALAFDEAANHFERALAALEAADSPDPKRRCELTIRCGDALFRAGLGDRAERTFHRVLDLARELGSPLHFALAIFGYVRELVPANPEPERYALLVEAIEGLGDDYPILRARLEAFRAGRLVWMGDPDAAREAASRAFSMLRDAEDMDARSAASAVYSIVVLGPTDNEQRLELALDQVRRAEAFGERASSTAPGFGVLQAARFAGRSDLADEYLERARDIAEQTRSLPLRAWVERNEAFRALDQGRLEDARGHSWRAREMGMRLNLALASEMAGTHTWARRRMEGRIAETLPALQAGAAAQPTVNAWRGLLACTHAELGDVESAREQLEFLSEDDFARIRQNPINDGVDLYAPLTEACIVAEQRGEAAALYQRLIPLEGQALQLPVMIPFGSAARCLGNLAVFLDRFDDAERHFEGAVAFDRRTGANGWLPRTQCDYARMLLQRSGPGDREKALALLDEAMALSQQLGLKGWLDRCIETKLIAQGVDSGSTSAKGTIDAVVASLDSRRLDLSMHAAADGNITLVFSDIEGFTPLTERLGDVRAHEVVRQHNAIVREQLAIHGGNEVEMQGDAFLLAFESPRRALECAVAIQRALAQRDAESEEPIRIRIGLHTGEALRDAARFFGLTVILAARIAAQASGEEILVSRALKERVSGSGDFDFDAGRQVKLKGISESQEVFGVRWLLE